MFDADIFKKTIRGLNQDGLYKLEDDIETHLGGLTAADESATNVAKLKLAMIKTEVATRKIKLGNNTLRA